MSRIERYMFTYILGVLIVLKELLTKYFVVLDKSFNNFIIDYLQVIYDEDKRLLIDKVLVLFGLYLIFFYVFSSVFSVNVESFKKIIKFNSTNILSFYKNSLLFFGKIFFKNSIAFLMLITFTYVIFSRDYNYQNYLLGFLELAKLPLMIFGTIIFSVIFNIKRVVVFSSIYGTITLYIFFVKYISYSHLLILYILLIILCVTQLLAKNDL